MIRSSLAAASTVALFLSTSSLPAVTLDWEPVVGPGAVTAAGFGDANNTALLSAVVFNGQLYLGTFNQVTGAEVWRSADGTSWTQVNTDGFGHPENQGVYSMGTFLTYVFAGTWGGFTLGPPTRVWRSSSGTSWTQANVDDFGDTDNAEPLAMREFNGFLHVGVSNFPDGTEVWESINGFNWTAGSFNGFGDTDHQQTFDFAALGGYLYAGTENTVDGGRVFRTDGAGLDWSAVGSSGFGDSGNSAVRTLEVLDGTLYAGTWNGATGAEVWRSSNGTTWSQANADGFGDTGNLGAVAMTAADGALYVGTYRAGGGGVWASMDGTSWSQVGAAGFGLSGNFSVNVLVEHEGALYAGTSNGSGLQVYRTPTPLFLDGFESGGTTAWTATSP